MTPKYQPAGSRLCGQTCIAMIADITIERAIEVFGHGHGTRTKEIVQALRTLGFTCGDALKRVSGKNKIPEKCIVNVVWDKENGGYHRHWIVCWGGEFFNPDPEEGYRVTSFLQIEKKGGEDVQGSDHSEKQDCVHFGSGSKRCVGEGRVGVRLWDEK